MAIHAMDLSSPIDHMVIFLGDLRRLVAAVQWRGVQVTAVSTLQAPTLRRQPDRFSGTVGLALEAGAQLQQ